MLTPELDSAIDAVSRNFNGFFFGRYDVRVRSTDALMAGRDFKVIEVNGVTSEATHIYHPGTPILHAWKVLMTQWRIAWEIGDANRKKGARPATVAELLSLLRNYREPRLAPTDSPRSEQA